MNDDCPTKPRRSAMAWLALGLAAGPLGVRAQPSGRVWRIGYLGPPVDTAAHLLKAFQDGLRDVGYVEGRNAIVDYRYTAGRGALLATRRSSRARARSSPSSPTCSRHRSTRRSSPPSKWPARRRS